MCEDLICTLEKYIIDYYKKVTANNAQQVILDFNKRWETVTDNTNDNTSRGLLKFSIDIPKDLSKYGIALIILSEAYYRLSPANEDDISRLSRMIEEYERKVEYKFDDMQKLFGNLGLCWYKLGELYDNRAIEAFKKQNYYQIALSNNTSIHTTAYAFRKCNAFLYQALVNEQLNLSSPTTFNDPFDCLIIPLMKLFGNNTSDKVSIMIRKAFIDCLKIACFTSNVKLPYFKDPQNSFSELIKNDKKHKKDKKEFLNSLMWAHYADSHRGICIKYNFYYPVSLLGGEDKNIVAYFKDVKYSADIGKYTNQNSINLEDAFFVKGKEWEYENELRLLYYDLNSKNDYGTIDIPNCIEAIYFGLKCSEKDKETIMNIMKDKKLVIKDINGNKIGEDSIKFYQMEFDNTHFGQIKAVKIN